MVLKYVRRSILYSFLSLIFSFNSSAFLDNSIKVEIPSGYDVFTLPIPNNTLPLLSKVFIHIEGKRIPAKISYSLLWPKKNSVALNVRVLDIELEHKTISVSNMTLSFESSSSGLAENKKYSSYRAKLIYPNKTWLREVLLLTNNNGVNESWYRHNQALQAIYLADEEALAKKKYPKTVASQWLYDRPQAFYQLYLSAHGREEIKLQADRFVAYYKSQINDAGYFKLAKPKDVKYLMGRSLVYHYLLNQSMSSLQTLENMFKASLSWKVEYNGEGFWTERHFAAALNIAISYWEISSNETAKNRIDELIRGLVQMTFSPPSHWKLRNCPQHTYKSHEGWGDSSPTCSPWMMALLADNLWRYYLLTDNNDSAKLLSAFATFMLNEGVYFGAGKKLSGRIIPKYIVSLDNKNQEELEPYSDVQHTCDVAAMVGKGVFVKKILKVDFFLEGHLFRAMSEQCKKDHLAIVEKYKYVKLDYLSSRPPRKFGWQYSSTDDLPWLMYELFESSVE
jgi:hypothetical protein